MGPPLSPRPRWGDRRGRPGKCRGLRWGRRCFRCVPGLPAPTPGLQEGPGRVPGGAGPGSGPREPEQLEGEEFLAGEALRPPLQSALSLGSGPPAGYFGPGDPGPGPGCRGGASGVHGLLFLAGAAGARGLFIDQTVRAPCVNGTPRASPAQTFQAPLSLRPLGLPGPRRLPPEPHRPPRPCMARASRPCVRGAPAPPRASRSA